MPHKREQSVEAESQVNTRQDRNLLLTDGGNWSWNLGTGTLSWSGIARVRRGGISEDTIAAGSQAGVSGAGLGVYAVVDRGAAGALTTLALAVDQAAYRTDGAVLLGVRGQDDRLYLRDGTVLGDGESKPLGGSNTLTDRAETAATGASLYTVGFTYATGTNQLAVYVGGILQVLGTHYVETSSTQITFQAPHIPVAGELISFINLIGGEGPPASVLVTLQEAYNDSSPKEVDVTAGGAATWYDSSPVTGFGDPVIQTADDAAASAAAFAALTNAGFLNIYPASGAGAAGVVIKDNQAGAGRWLVVPADDASGDLLLMNNATGEGICIHRDGSGLAFGSYDTTGDAAYPGNTWSDNGSMRWSLYTGTFNGTGDAVTVATGFTGGSIRGVMLMLEDGSSSDSYIAWESSTAGDSTRDFAVTVNDTTGDILISRAADGTGDPGGASATFNSAEYRVIVFHQG